MLPPQDANNSAPTDERSTFPTASTAIQPTQLRISCGGTAGVAATTTTTRSASHVTGLTGLSCTGPGGTVAARCSTFSGTTSGTGVPPPGAVPQRAMRQVHDQVVALAMGAHSLKGIKVGGGWLGFRVRVGP